MMVKKSLMYVVGFFLVASFIMLEIQIQNLRVNTFYDTKHVIRDFSAGSDDPMNSEFFGQDTALVLYNRVPKTGSTSFTNFVYDSCKRNGIHVLHINTTKNSHIMSLQDQYDLVQNITAWGKIRPAFFHGHMAYLDFRRFGSPLSPMYINIVRDPLDRLISYYYFLRYGDDYRKGLKRARQGDKTTFDECVKKKGGDCAVEKLWLQIPFFCGQSAECWDPGNDWALQEAKKNLVDNYLLVGLTEQMEEFFLVLETVLPKMFRGITENYRHGTKSHIRKTLHKETPSEETSRRFHDSKIWKMEMELYQFAKDHFEFVKKQSTILDSNGVLVRAPRRYRYEKIYGPNGQISKS